MAGNPWDADTIVTPASAPAPLPVSATQGIIERPGQPTPAYVNVQSAPNAWDADKVVTPAPAAAPAGPETAGRVAGLTARALAASGGDLYDTIGNAVAATDHAGKFIADTLRHMVGLNSGTPAMPFNSTHGRQTAEQSATAAGLPQPSGTGEQLYTAGAEIAPALVAGSGELRAATSGVPTLAKALGKYGMGAYGTYKLLHEVASGGFTAEHAKSILETLSASE